MTRGAAARAGPAAGPGVALTVDSFPCSRSRPSPEHNASPLPNPRLTSAAPQRVAVLLLPLPPRVGGRLAPGCQYAKFSPDSAFLAASSDALFSVFVFAVPRRQLLFTLRHTQCQPPLALAFLPPGSPAGGPVLVHATDRRYLVVADVARPRCAPGRSE